MGKMTNILTLPKRYNEIAIEIEREFSKDTTDALSHLNSLGSDIIFDTEGKDLCPYPVEVDAASAPGCIFPQEKGRLVASIDSTCMPLAYSGSQLLYAARVSVVFSTEGRVTFYSRIGPVLSSHDILSQSREQIESCIRREMETRAANSIMSSGFEGILLLDGSLKHPDSVRVDKNEDADVAAFSKMSVLALSGLDSSLYMAEYPSYITIQKGKVTTLLAKMTKKGIVFRIDIISKRKPEEVLGLILYNDLFYAGYPESLRLAHHLSVFNRAELIAMQAIISKQLRVRNSPSFDIRKVALGTLKVG